MARVLLIMAQLPQRLAAPYVGQQSLAASLLAAGYEVRCLDLAATGWRQGDAPVLAAVESWQPDAVGMTLFTYNARRSYELAATLRSRVELLVAGGPHASACPREPLANGFDAVVQGEGERVFPALLEAGASATPKLPGVYATDARGPPAVPIEDLDALPFPHESRGCYEAGWYPLQGGGTAGGIVSSRGCPARCTFCANYVTGRRHRWRSPASVLAEMRELRRRHGQVHFPFWDDAFTASRRRVIALCDALLADASLRDVTWTCITPASLLKPGDLGRMRRAGCLAVNFGIESGDERVLSEIRKGQRPSQVEAGVRAAKAEGMTTIVNFMFGFPGEGVPELDRTRELMERLAASTDLFNHRGVLVPFPGTALYERWHHHYGFGEWWLDPARLPREPDLHAAEPARVAALLEGDPVLELDFFRYDDEVRARIADCLRFKARHNRETQARWAASAPAAAPGAAEAPYSAVGSGFDRGLDTSVTARRGLGTQER